MRNLFLFLLLGIFAWPTIAGAQCENFSTDAYIPEDFEGIEYEPWELECCCFDNDISLDDYDEVLRGSDVCCDFESAPGCELWTISVLLKADPTVHSGSRNKFVSGEVQYTEVTEWKVTNVCICGSPGTPMTCGDPVIEDGTLYNFECEGCPE